jgi:hypothetical protein
MAVTKIAIFRPESFAALGSRTDEVAVAAIQIQAYAANI